MLGKAACAVNPKLRLPDRFGATRVYVATSTFYLATLAVVSGAGPRGHTTTLVPTWTRA
jgi:hypothetical protein